MATDPDDREQLALVYGILAAMAIQVICFHRVGRDYDRSVPLIPRYARFPSNTLTVRPLAERCGHRQATIRYGYRLRVPSAFAGAA